MRAVEAPVIQGEWAEVLANQDIARDLVLLRLRSPEIACACRPAQFVNIRTDEGGAPYLRRPFSVLRVDRSDGWLDLYFQIVGPGTGRLSASRPGDRLHLIGPLGLPFDPPPSARLLLVAGGVGIVPLAFLAWEAASRRNGMLLLFGAQSASRLPEVSALVPPDLGFRLATDDGSLGHRGFVTDLIEEVVLPGRTVLLTCGPHAMMARAAAIAKDLGVPCFASLENHMACGFGACVGCVVEVRRAPREDLRYRRVCLEGPVFDAHAIVW